MPEAVYLRLALGKPVRTNQTRWQVPMTPFHQMRDVIRDRSNAFYQRPKPTTIVSFKYPQLFRTGRELISGLLRILYFSFCYLLANI